MSQLIELSDGNTTVLELVLQLRFKLNASVARVQQNRQTSLGESDGWTSPFLSLDERRNAHPEHSFIINGYTRDTKCYHSALLVSTDHTCGLEVALQSVIPPAYIFRQEIWAQYVCSIQLSSFQFSLAVMISSNRTMEIR
jgi:hypothetical protein